MKDLRRSIAAKWRWAKTLCPGCKVKGKHIRGFHACEKNPNPDMFGFTRKMGK
jgi:hypothetical protein